MDNTESLPFRTLYRRRCDITGEGMNSGWLFGDGAMYIKYEKDLIAELRGPNWKDFWTDMKPTSERTDDEVLEVAFEQDICHWTEWEDLIAPDDECYTLHGVELHTEAERKAYLNAPSMKKFFNVDPKKGITDHLKDAYEDSIMLERILTYCSEYKADLTPYQQNPLDDEGSSTFFFEFPPDAPLANISWHEGDMQTKEYTSPSWLMGNIQEALQSIIALYLEHDKQATINL